MPFARIELAGRHAEEGETLIIHLRVKADGTPDKRYAYAGWRGQPGENRWCWPVVFGPEGRVDHGGERNSPAATRYSSMPFYDTPLKVGNIYTMTHNDGSPATELRLVRGWIENDADQLVAI